MQSLVEPLSDLHRVLTGHAVGDEQDLVGMNRGLQTLQLAHHVVVDLQTTRCVDDDHAIARALRLLDALLRDLLDVTRRAIGVYGHVELRTERLQLIDSRGTVDVSRDETRRLSLGFELSSELRGGRRLSGA